MKILCKEIAKINNATSKTHIRLIQIKSVKGMEQKWFFDTCAGLTCLSLKAFRKIANEYRSSKINFIGTKASGACGSALIPEGVCMIPMEWNSKKIMQPVQAYRKLSQPIILGVDGIHNLGITYGTETKELMFQSDNLKSTFASEDLKTVCMHLLKKTSYE